PGTAGEQAGSQHHHPGGAQRPDRPIPRWGRGERHSEHRQREHRQGRQRPDRPGRAQRRRGDQQGDRQPGKGQRHDLPGDHPAEPDRRQRRGQGDQQDREHAGGRYLAGVQQRGLRSPPDRGQGVIRVHQRGCEGGADPHEGDRGRGRGGQQRPDRRADQRSGQILAVGGPVGSGPQQLGQYGQEHRRRRVHPGGLGGRQTGQRGAGGRDGHPDRDVPRVGQAHRSTPHRGERGHQRQPQPGAGQRGGGRQGGGGGQGAGQRRQPAGERHQRGGQRRSPHGPAGIRPGAGRSPAGHEQTHQREHGQGGGGGLGAGRGGYGVTEQG